LQSDWYFAWQPPDPNRASLFSDVNASRHAHQRRKYASAYSMSSLVTYEPYVDNCLKLMVQRFSELAEGKTFIDMAHWLQCYAFDMIGEITFGDRFGFLDMGSDDTGVFGAIDAANTYSVHIGVFGSRLHKLIFPLLATSGGIAHLAAFTAARVSDRQKALKDPKSKTRAGPPDFLTKFVATHEQDPEKMTTGDLLTICTTNIRAGSDTTGVTLSAIFYYLFKFPATFYRLRKEIDDAAMAGKASEPISFKEAQELPYLQAVIKEGLRMHPATGLPLMRLVPAGGATISGRHFPEKSTVGVNAWVAHRNSSVYGPDADSWRPERWLEFEMQGRGAEVERYFFSFGQGTRTCIGKNISMLEISKLVPTMVRRFDFELSEELVDKGWKTLNRWFVKQLNFEVKVMLRQKSSLTTQGYSDRADANCSE